MAIERGVLRQTAWYACQRDRTTLGVDAPTPPSGFRPVVTRVVPAGQAVRTGTRLASVAGVPLIAVVTNAPFYRPLAAGDRGPDVTRLERALLRAGVISEADGIVDSGTLEAWREQFNPLGPAGVIPLTSLVAVPSGAVVDSVAVTRGSVARPGTELMQVGTRSTRFTCQVPDSSGELARGSLDFEVDGRRVDVTRVVVVPRGRGAPGYVTVSPARRVTGGDARLGVVAASSEGEVLHAPASVLKADSSGRQVVLVVEDGETHEVPVSVGITAAGHVELSGRGLGVGQELVLLDPRRP
ncbi:hypothetical protein [Nocardioides seonyuensis]|uniref:hypothetical protein n=1 Tax=Nocardioides seonyuensis TaxID=2518371 RepID=UPI0014211220|nr:hypothetical protein [Nocardioides seonyuensis]